MGSFSVGVEDPRTPLPRERQLAWKIAEVATAAPVDPAAAEMVENRIIDNAAVGLAALSSHAVRSARAQALAFPRPRGATLLGSPSDRRVDCGWAAWANGTAVRELDLHDNFYGFGVAHPADAIPPLLAVAEQCGRGGTDLQRAILTAYEVVVALSTGIDLNTPGVDHVAHLGPAVAAGLGALLELETDIVFQAVNQAAHLSCAPLQARKGAISSWKAAAPAHVGKLAIEAMDRAMRGQDSPVPIYEGVSGLLATFFRSAKEGHSVHLPDPGEPRRAILQTYPKAHAAAYHAQALIDLAFRLGGRIEDVEEVASIVIHTKAYTHNQLGTGANDPSRMDPLASRETLDHSIMYIFAVALQDGGWHHERSYLPERARRPDTVRLWHKIRTEADPEWSRRFAQPAPFDKDHGGRVVITLRDGGVLEDEVAVPTSHPRGSRPFSREDYAAKFSAMTEGLVDAAESARFLESVAGLRDLPAGTLHRLSVEARRGALEDGLVPRAIFDAPG